MNLRAPFGSISRSLSEPFMETPVVSAPMAPAPPRRRWPRRVLKAVLLLIGVAVGAYYLLAYLGTRDLAAAIAEADRLDPGWRLDEMQAARAKLADGENSALQVLAADALLRNFPAWPAELRDPPSLIQSFVELAPQAQLSVLQAEALKAVLTDAQPALLEARKLADMPHGRYAALPAADAIWNATGATQLISVKKVSDLLEYDVLLQAHLGDPDAALESCRALLNAARSLGDEASFVVQYHRLLLRAQACRKIERVLAQGKATEASLVALQRLLADEEAEPLFLWGARGNRVGWDQLFEKIQAGGFRNQRELVPRYVHLVDFRGDRAATLRLGTEMVEIAKAPVEDRDRLFAEQKTLERRMPFFSDTYIRPKIQRFTSDLHKGELRSRAQLRCTIAALAAERYRRAQGVWPQSLAALVPAQLAAAPVDPYDGQPLRMRRTKGGLVIYSVGPDRQDNQGAVDIKGPGPAVGDVGCRLWDVPQRRRVTAP
jgi:hypothetical protein